MDLKICDMKTIKKFLIKFIKKFGLLNDIPNFKRRGLNLVLENPFYIMGADYTTIGDNFTARRNLKMRAFSSFNGDCFNPSISIGNNVSIETDCHIGCINKIIIGNNVLIASGVYISDHSHGALDFSDIDTSPLERSLASKGPIIVEDNVWIGERAVILAGVKIGNNSIIGANAVVTKDVPSYSIVAGVPAKVIKTIPHQ